jgi:hypothetical protein
MTHLQDNIWAVEVPSMAFGLDINNYGGESELMYMLSMEDIDDVPNSEETLIVKPLPKGPWQIICMSKEATSEQAASIVEEAIGGFAGHIKGYKDYMSVGMDIQPMTNPIDSLRSLLASKGLTGNNYVILKKV